LILTHINSIYLSFVYGNTDVGRMKNLVGGVIGFTVRHVVKCRQFD